MSALELENLQKTLKKQNELIRFLKRELEKERIKNGRNQKN